MCLSKILVVPIWPPVWNSSVGATDYIAHDKKYTADLDGENWFDIKVNTVLYS